MPEVDVIEEEKNEGSGRLSQKKSVYFDDQLSAEESILCPALSSRCCFAPGGFTLMLDDVLGIEDVCLLIL